MAIRYDSQLKAQIRKTVKSFNAKIRRLEAKGVSAALLPNKISSKEIQAGFVNRRDLRKRLNQLSDFTSAGIVEETQTGLLGTDKLFMYRQGEANRAIEELRKEYNELNTVNTRYPMMLGEYESNLRTKMNYLARDIRTLDIKQVNIFNRNLLSPEQRRKKDDTFYKNFQKMIFFNAYKGSVSPTLATEVIELLQKFTPQQLLHMYNTNPNMRIFEIIDSDEYRRRSHIKGFDEEETNDIFIAIRDYLKSQL